MKHYFLFLAFLTWQGITHAQTVDCQDNVFLKDGSLLKGKITSYDLSGELVMTTWSGVVMHIPATGINKVKQRCKDDPRRMRISAAPYSFNETGWYHATRGAFLPGASATGVGLQHSSGIMLNRLIGLGAGAGMEQFNPGSYAPASYPMFGEIRGYLLKKNITPFYTVGAGYSWMPRHNRAVIFDGNNSEWKGGFLFQGQIGYRIGNHFTVHGGIRLQRMTEAWTSSWLSSFYGVNTYLYKRFELGVGLLL